MKIKNKICAIKQRNMVQQSTIFDTLKSSGYVCSCCGQYVKEYTRSFNCNMALLLIRLYKHQKTGWVHIEKFLAENGYSRCGDFSYMTHYKLLQKLNEDRPDGSSRNGYYKLTGTAIMFIEGKLTVAAKFKMFNSKFMGFEGEQIDIKTALGKRFDYQELMSN